MPNSDDLKNNTEEVPKAKVLSDRITRRQALSTAGKAGIGAAAIIIIGGVAYVVSQQGARPTTTVTTTAPATTVTTTAPATTVTTTTSVAAYSPISVGTSDGYTLPWQEAGKEWGKAPVSVTSLGFDSHDKAFLELASPTVHYDLVRVWAYYKGEVTAGKYLTDMTDWLKTTNWFTDFFPNIIDKMTTFPDGTIRTVADDGDHAICFLYEPLYAALGVKPSVLGGDPANRLDLFKALNGGKTSANGGGINWDFTNMKIGSGAPNMWALEHGYGRALDNGLTFKEYWAYGSKNPNFSYLDDKKNPLVTDPVAVEALQMEIDEIPYAIPNVLGQDYGGLSANMFQAKVATFPDIGGGWKINLKTPADSPNGAPYRYHHVPRGVFAWPVTMGINQNVSKDKIPELYSYIDFMFQVANAKKMVLANPPWGPNFADDITRKSLADPAGFPEVNQQFPGATLGTDAQSFQTTSSWGYQQTGALSGVDGGPVNQPNGSLLFDILDQNLVQAFSGTQSAKDALQKTNDAWVAKIDKTWPYL